MNELPGPSLIDRDRLLSMLGPFGKRFVIELLPECTSTNTLLCERLRQGAPAGLLLVADRQTAGRGRLGRTWLSAPEASLTFSLLWRFDDDVARLAGLSLAVGVALAQALEACGVTGVELKWPNDVLLNGGKVGGVLIELEAQRDGLWAVMGVGLNLFLPDVEGEDFLHPPAALADALSSPPDRQAILAQLLLGLANTLDRFAAGGFSALREDWQKRHAWQGRQVRLLDSGRVDREGRCLGADTDGALLLETPAGIERCFSGDVSLRAT